MNFDFSLVPTATLALMMLALGMELRPEDFSRLLRLPGAAIFGVVGQLLLLPCIAIGLALTMPLAMATGMGLVLLAACPGGATSNMFSRYAAGDVALSISLTAASSIAAPITVPLVVGLGLNLIAGREAQIPVSMVEMVTTLVATTALPVAVGMSILRWKPTIAERLRGKLLATATTVMVLLVIGLAVNTTRVQPDVLGMFARSSAAVLVLFAVCVSVVAIGSRWLKFPGAQERTLVLEVGLQNINLALVVALNFLQNSEYLGPTLVYLPFMLLLGGGVVWWGRREVAAA